MSLDETLQLYNKAMKLRAETGDGPWKIARQIGVSQATVQHWIYRHHRPHIFRNSFNQIPSSELSYLLGAMLGDGYAWHGKKQCYKVVMTVKDKDFVETVSKVFQKLFHCGPNKISEQHVPEYPDTTYYRIEYGSRQFWQLMRSPLPVLRDAIGDYKKEFIGGFYDAEGSLNIKNRFSVNISNTNPELSNLVFGYLEELGYNPIMTVSEKPVWNTEYRVSVCGPERVRRFVKEIGSSIERKRTLPDQDPTGKKGWFGPHPNYRALAHVTDGMNLLFG